MVRPPKVVIRNPCDVMSANLFLTKMSAVLRVYKGWAKDRLVCWQPAPMPRYNTRTAEARRTIGMYEVGEVLSRCSIHHVVCCRPIRDLIVGGRSRMLRTITQLSTGACS